MASPLSLLLLFLLAFSSAQTHARENQFFSKTTREQPDEGTPPTTGASAAAATAAEKERVSAAFPPQSQGGYGLYGRGPDHFPPATTSSGRYGAHNYNGGSGGRGTEVDAVYNYGKQWPQEDKRPSRYSEGYDANAAAATAEATTRKWSDEVDTNKQTYSYGVNGGRDQFAYGVYNYGGRTENYGGRRNEGYGRGHENNDAASMDESREEYDP